MPLAQRHKEEEFCQSSDSWLILCFCLFLCQGQLSPEFMNKWTPPLLVSVRASDRRACENRNTPMLPSLTFKVSRQHFLLCLYFFIFYLKVYIFLALDTIEKNVYSFVFFCFFQTAWSSPSWRRVRLFSESEFRSPRLVSAQRSKLVFLTVSWDLGHSGSV